MPLILDVSMRREATKGAPIRTPATAPSSTSHVDLSTNSGFSSDVLNVNFDLMLDDWDNFSDDNFTTACDELYHPGRGSDPTAGASFLLDGFVCNISLGLKHYGRAI